MKKIICLILLVSALAVTLFGCSKSVELSKELDPLNIVGNNVIKNPKKLDDNTSFSKEAYEGMTSYEGRQKYFGYDATCSLSIRTTMKTTDFSYHVWFDEEKAQSAVELSYKIIEEAIKSIREPIKLTLHLSEQEEYNDIQWAEAKKYIEESEDLSELKLSIVWQDQNDVVPKFYYGVTRARIGVSMNFHQKGSPFLK